MFTRRCFYSFFLVSLMPSGFYRLRCAVALFFQSNKCGNFSPECQTRSFASAEEGWGRRKFFYIVFLKIYKTTLSDEKGGESELLSWGVEANRFIHGNCMSQIEIRILSCGSVDINW